MSFRKYLAAKSLATIMTYTTLTAGCISFLDDVENSKKEEKVYTGAEAELAYCLRDSAVVRGLGDGGYRSGKQSEIFGPQAWEIMQDIYTECFEDGQEELLPECQTYLGPEGGVDKSIFPMWFFLNDEKGFVTLGVLTLKNFADNTSEFGCEYNPQ